MNINWYPGHMAKTKRLISEDLKLVDAVVEVLDARIPISSKNPDIDTLCQNKPKIVLLNKSDMADDFVTDLWISDYRAKGILALKVNCESGEGLKRISSDLKELLKEKLLRNEQKGVFKPIRIMVVGIPNSGKSSFINRIANNKRLKTEDRPGVTVHKQWVKVSNEIELMDTPGILWPKLGDEKVALHLAFTGAIKSQILDVEELGVYLIDYLLNNHPNALMERYKITLENHDDKLTVYDKIAFKRGYIFSKDDPDYERCANAVLDDFKNGRFGKLSLETPEEI